MDAEKRHYQQADQQKILGPLPMRKGIDNAFAFPELPTQPTEAVVNRAERAYPATEYPPEQRRDGERDKRQQRTGRNRVGREPGPDQDQRVNIEKKLKPGARRRIVPVACREIQTEKQHDF